MNCDLILTTVCFNEGEPKAVKSFFFFIHSLILKKILRMLKGSKDRERRGLVLFLTKLSETAKNSLLSQVANVSYMINR